MKRFYKNPNLVYKFNFIFRSYRGSQYVFQICFFLFLFWEVIVAFQRILKKAKRKFNPSQKFWNQF